MSHWWTVVELAIGVGLSIIIGIEREYHAKSAGIRTCALVGLGATLFTAVSRHGAWILPGLTVTNVDGSRVAAQIVSGIGFLGAGLIFVRRDSVQGLTTAASVWLVAAIGMAAGAGVPDLAIAATGLYLIVVVGIQPLRRWLPRARLTRDCLWVSYGDGKGALRDIMGAIGEHGVSVDSFAVLSGGDLRDGRRVQRVRIDVHSAGGSITQLLHALAEVPNVYEVSSEGRGAVRED